MADIPFDQLDGYIWMNGEMVPWAESKIHLLSHGLHYASCVFEGQRIYNGKIFKLKEHCERLHNSAAILDFEIPYSVDELIEASNAVMEKQNLTEGYMRPVAWRGSEQMGIAAQKTKINVAIAAWEWGSYFDPIERMKGIRLRIADYCRPDPRTAPCRSKAAGLYMICTIEKHKAEKLGFTDALMLDWRGQIAECTGANVFFIKDGVIHTPDPDCFLDGITRRTVMGLAKDRGIEVIERVIMPDELSDFSECFITGSAAEITPVSGIDDHGYTPGDISKNLLDDYMKLVRE